MNATADQKIITPGANDPAHLAAHSLREADSTRLPRPHEPRTYRPLATSITDTTLNTQIDSALDDSSLPLEPEAVDDPGEPEPRGVLGAIARVATAIGAAALVALLFVIVIPSLRQQSADTSSAAAIESLKSAMAKSEQAAKLPDTQPLPELQSILASSTSSAPANRQESEALLQQFMQWQQKPADTQDNN